MLTQEEGDDDIANGWPLGLENMNIKLRVPDHIQTAERNSLRVANSSSSFSTFSSSDLDTESSASFFRDQSVSLGRLIGMRHGADREGRLYFPNAIHLPNDHQRLLVHSDVSSRGVNNEMEMSCGICVPQFCNIIVKMSRSKTCPRH